jgi:signal transduction histidine kinase
MEGDVAMVLKQSGNRGSGPGQPTGLTRRGAGKNSRESALFFAVLILLFLAVTALSLVVVAGQRRRNTLLEEYQADRLAGALLEAFRRGELPDGLPMGDQLLGFGIYTGSGDALVRAGTAPPAVQPAQELSDGGLPPRSSFHRDRRRGTLTLIRPLGTRPRGLGGRDGPGGMTPGMMGHMMPKRGQAPTWTGRAQAEAPQLLYLELSGGRYFAHQRTLEVAQVLLPLFILGSMAFVAVLYRNNLAIRRRLISREQLARLGEASRTLSHEIKNPLSAIRIQTGILKKTLPEEQREGLKVIEEEVGRLAVLVDRIGDFLRDPLGQPESVDLDRFIRELALRYDQVIRYAAAPEGAVRVWFDPQRLRSVLENLINNALEAAPGGPVEVTAAISRQEVQLGVLDRGPGVPEELRRKVFDPFFTSKVQGSGVGLAIARRFVEAAGGSLTLENRAGGGAEARVRLRRGGT